MPVRSRSEAATWPGSGIALDDGAISFGFTEMKEKGQSRVLSLFFPFFQSARQRV
jgi:hypothetical protein